MVSNNIYKGIDFNKIIDNGNKIIGPVLLKQDHVESESIISGKHDIFQPGSANLINEVVKVISQTKQFLCVSSFLIQDSKIIDEIRKCYERGARVYILTAAETQLSDPNEDDDSTLEARKKASRDMLNNLGSHVLIHTGNNLHAKFLVSDPKTQPKAIVFTSNLTVRALTENIELAVELSEKLEVMELFRQFLYGFWAIAERELDPYRKLSPINRHPEFLDINYKPEKLKWTLDNQLLIKDVLEKMIDSAETYISLSAWTIDSEHPLAEKIIKKASEGVKVTLFTRPHNANKEFISKLISNGGTVYCHKLLHAKSIIVDGKDGLIMTANISKLGLDEGFETAVILTKAQIDTLAEIHREWQYRCEYKSEQNIMLKDIKDRWINLNRSFEELPKPEKTEIHLEVTAKTLRDYYDGNIDPYIPIKEQKNTDNKEIHYTITLLPPTLPPEVEKMKPKEENNLKIYHTKKGNYICIKTKEQLPEAEELSKQNHAIIVLCNE
ncbi:MAG: phospholipase D-like domain-containing protein [Ferroplasma sp.]|uniref:phospholipase D-like domain-containing protein n=1 Tax=Ferroplasma sp. TaxID=2591003 RepID=UPI0028153E6E|nr:phospholipase D-like domain-containing protein [Ferroplasma sp.]WMT50540.1 MAG: phospholipase D-like domain-containing protein [Ferroplasma sp.]